MIEPQKLIDYTRSATADVFSTMLGMESEALEPRTDAEFPTISDGVMALVGMAGTWTGAGVICCSAQFACQLCNQFIGASAEAVDEEVLDAVGELANMIIGSFKTSVEEHVGALGLSVPTVIYGRNFTSRSIGQNAWIVLPFRSGEEIFEVRICLAQAKEPVTPRAGYNHMSTVLA
jgi:chemotaxis protein CheX